MLQAEYQALVDEVHVITDLKTAIGHGFGAQQQVIAQLSGRIAELEKAILDHENPPPEVVENLNAVKDATAQLVMFADSIKSAIPANTDVVGQPHDDGTPQPVLNAPQGTDQPAQQPSDDPLKASNTAPVADGKPKTVN